MNGTECPGSDRSISFIILAVLSSLSGLVAITGNVLVLLAIYTTRSLRTTSNLFIASLAASDFLVGSVMDPILAARSIKYSYLGVSFNDKNPFKKGVDFLWIQAVIATTFGLMAVSVDRYVAITKVFLYDSMFTSRRSGYIITFIWIFSFVFASLRLFLPDSKLALLWVSTAILSCGIPFTVTAYCYLAIFKAARKQLKRIVNETTAKETRRIEEARHRKTAWTIGIVIALFFFLWIPSLIVASINLTLEQGCTKENFSRTVWIWVEWVAYNSSAVNPWVYSMRSAEFRIACKQSLGLQKTRIIPEEMISRSKARPSVIDLGTSNPSPSNRKDSQIRTSPDDSQVNKQLRFKDCNFLLPPVV